MVRFLGLAFGFAFTLAFGLGFALALGFGFAAGFGLDFGFGFAAGRATTSSRMPAIRAFSRLVFMTQATSLSVERNHFSKYGPAFSGAAAAATLQQ